MTNRKGNGKGLSGWIGLAETAPIPCSRRAWEAFWPGFASLALAVSRSLACLGAAAREKPLVPVS